MITLILPAAAALMSVTAPSAALATPVVALDDHPAPPFNTYPECERAARRWAWTHSYDRYIWGWEYIYNYENYIYNNCGMID